MIFLKTVLIAGFMLLGLSVQAEESQISLSVTNQPLGKVLASIEKASGIDVVLSDKKWAKELVSFSVRNSDPEKALDTVFRQYDYVLEWYAVAGELSKVLITVYEKKDGVAMAAVSPPMPVEVSQPTEKKALDYSKISAFPPGPNGEKSISVEDLRSALAKAEKRVNREMISAFPPRGLGQGVSAAELGRQMGTMK